MAGTRRSGRIVRATVPVRRLATGLLVWLVRGYRLLVSPVLPPSCRFHPTCSGYAIEALKTHGPVRGGVMALARIARCHPWGGQGFDPVPRARR